MIQIQQQLAHLNTVRESLDIISNSITSLKEGVNNIDLASVIDKIEASTEEITNILNGIQLDIAELAKESTLNNSVHALSDKIDNTEATNTKILEETAKESTIVAESQAIKDKIDNIDFTTIENKITDGVNSLSVMIDNIDLSAVESKVQYESAEIKEKIDNIDLSSVAKQGGNPDATNSAILKAVSAIVDTKNLYSVRFESNDDGPNTYTMVLPVVAGVVGDTIIL